jgi:SAM-dependent methyltransferase
VIAVDSSSVALDLARQRALDEGLAVDWRLGSALALPVADRSIDLALDRGCLHVISRRYRRRYAKEVARVLRPGGTLVLWAAREDEEEDGLIGVTGYELNRLFGPRGFDAAVTSEVSLASRSGALAARRFRLRRGAKPRGGAR